MMRRWINTTSDEEFALYLTPNQNLCSVLGENIGISSRPESAIPARILGENLRPHIPSRTSPPPHSRSPYPAGPLTRHFSSRQTFPADKKPMCSEATPAAQTSVYGKRTSESSAAPHWSARKTDNRPSAQTILRPASLTWSQ